MVKTWLLAGVVLLAVPGLVGCSSEPKASALGPELQRDGTTLLEGVADIEHGGKKPIITDDASKDVPCGDGKVQRVFAGSAPLQPYADIDTIFDLSYNRALYFLDDERYDLTKRADSDDLARREFVATGKEELKVTLNFTFTAGVVPTLTLRGETACLEP
jgi:hypothetical protein